MLQVAQERMGFVLREHADFFQVGIEAVGQGEIDNAPIAAEIHRGLGAAVGHFVQTRAPPARQYQHQRVVGNIHCVRRAAVITACCVFIDIHL